MEELNNYVGRRVYVAQNIGKDRLDFLGKATVERAGNKYRLKFVDKEILISQGEIEKIVGEQHSSIRITLKRSEK